MTTTTLVPEVAGGIVQHIPIGTADLHARLYVIENAPGLVIVANGDGDHLYDDTNSLAAARLVERGFATLVVDLLTPNEAAEDAETSELRFNHSLLASRLIRVMRWMDTRHICDGLEVGFFASGLCAGAALAAASVYPAVRAVVCRGARIDKTVVPQLHHVKAAVLLLVGECDSAHLDASRGAFWLLPNSARLAVVPGAGHMLDDPAALDQVVEEAERWFGDAFDSRRDAMLETRPVISSA